MIWDSTASELCDEAFSFGTNGDGAAIFDVEEISELVRIFSFTLNGTDRTVFTSE